MPESQTPVEQPQDTYDIEAEPKPREPHAQRDPSTGKFVSRSVHPSRLVKLARDLGISDDEIQSTSSAELREAINDVRLERQFSRRSEAVEQPLERPSIPEDKWDGEDDIAPQIVQILKSLKGEIKSLKEENNQLKAFTHSQAVESFTQKADREFSELGPAFESMIGKGTKSDLEPDSFQMVLRDALVKEAVKLAGKNATTDAIASKIKVAAKLHLQGLTANPQENDSASSKRWTQSQWDEGALARPTQRHTGDELPKGAERAELAVAEYLRVNGQSNGRTSKDEFFP